MTESKRNKSHKSIWLTVYSSGQRCHQKEKIVDTAYDYDYDDDNHTNNNKEIYEKSIMIRMIRRVLTSVLINHDDNIKLIIIIMER